MNACGVKPPERSTATGSVPATSERTSTWMPAMWCAGIGSSHWPGPPSRSWVAVALATRASRLSIASLGLPVDPEVPMTSASPSGSAA